MTERDKPLDEDPTEGKDAESDPATAPGFSTDSRHADELLASGPAGLNAFENSHAVMLLVDPDTGVILDANAAAVAFYGWSRDELRGKPIYQINVLTREEVLRDARAAKEARRTHFYFRHRLADGSHRDVEVYSGPIHVEGQDLLLSIVHDITERREAEEALRESEHRLRTMIQTTADGFWIIDSQGLMSDVNEAYLAMSGYEREEVLGLSIGDLDAFEKPEETRARIQRIMEHGSELFEVWHKRKDGSLLPLEVSATYTEDAGGSFICFARNLTEKKEREERITLLAELLDTAPGSITVHDFRGRFLYANQKTLELHGYDDLDEFLSLKLKELDVPESATLVEQRIEQILAEGEARFEVSHFHKDGSRIPMEVWTKPIGWHGEPALLSVATDISERKEAEQALQASRERYQALFEQSKDGIYLHDLEGNILDVNQEALNQSGYTRQELLDMSVFDFLPDRSRKVGIIEQWQSWEPGDSFRIEDYHIHKDGKHYPVEIKIGKVRFGGKEYMLAVTRDITESRQLEEQLRQSQKMEAVGRLAGGIAHDFNNMLSVILGHSELGLQHLPRDHPLAKDLLEIQRAAERSAELTRQLLAFARRQTVEPKVLDLNQAVESLLSMLRRLIGEDLDLLWEPAPIQSPIRMDPAQLDQILANLVVNARDAITDPVGKITIETEEVEVDEEYATANPGFRPGRYAVLSVSDDGCGMDEETRSLVFEPFFTTKSTGEGTGLGLSTVYGVVSQNDGFIHVYSEPGHGSTFRIYLPAHEPHTGDSRSTASPAPSAREGHETILLVEDEPAILNLGKRMLENLGYEALAASTPGEALALAREYPGEIHLLLTDVVMPEMNGRELAKQLLVLYPGMKRLFVSGYTANVIAHHGVLEEGMDFLQKPFSLNALGEKLREIFEE